MPTTYWGVTDTLGIAMPTTWMAWVLLVLYCASFLFLNYRERSLWRAFGSSQWFALLVLAFAGLLTSQLLPVSLDSHVLGETSAVSLLTAVPYLLAGIFLGPAPALLVGLSTGLGRALGQTHAAADLFYFAFAAWVGALLMRQHYRSRLYHLLRQPVTAGAVSGIVIAVLAGLTTLVTVPSSLLDRLDSALLVAGSYLPVTFVEGLVAGAMLSLLFLFIPDQIPARQEKPAPGQDSIHSYLTTNILMFGAASLILTSLFAFTVSVLWSTRLNVAELAAAANASAVDLAALQTEATNTLEDLGNKEQLVGDGKISARTLGQFSRASQLFKEVLLVDAPSAGINDAVDTSLLSTDEKTTVTKALSGRTGTLAASLAEDSPGISIVVPVAEDNAARAALVGRIAPEALQKALGEADQTSQGRVTTILNSSGVPLLQTTESAVPLTWKQAFTSTAGSLAVPEAAKGSAYILGQESGERTLVFVGANTGQGWRIAVSMPYTNVLKQALAVALPLMTVLLALTGVFYARTTAYGRELSTPIAELAEASRTIASGGTLPARPAVERQDEIGELDRAFADMHVALKRRLDELSLLLTVSQEASSSIDLDDNIPVVLQGAMRGTSAAGARAVILNPSSGQPLTFAEGPLAGAMAKLDRPLMSLVRGQSEMILNNAAELSTYPELGSLPDLPIQALYAVRLGANNSFQGFIVLGFRRARAAIGTSELALLRTLAGQASLLIDKSYLFTNAEGGRRRLAAVLASTSDAVIVTDQTLRILIINRSFEQAFGLQAGQVVGRSIHDVIPSSSLVEALSQPDAERRDVEVVGRDRRIYFANASPIASHEGQILGRVAVLHDITHLKELDRVKSEFVENVSHDLRTPLTVLSGYATALSMLDDLTPEQRDYSNNILKSVDRISRLVEDLLDLGRIEAGVDLVLEPVNVGELLRSVANEHWLYAHESGAKLNILAAAELPTIRADRVLLNQALSNLLTNAFKYAPNSGDIIIAAIEVGSEVIFSVRDQGPGIAGQDQIQLFEKFYRVNRHGSGKAKGSGLGLAIVRSIAERHEGRAWCESELGRGSTFYLAVPIEHQTE